MSSRFGDQIFRADSARASVMDWINHKNRTCATPVLVPDQKFAWLVARTCRNLPGVHLRVPTSSKLACLWKSMNSHATSIK